MEAGVWFCVLEQFLVDVLPDGLPAVGVERGRRCHFVWGLGSEWRGSDRVGSVLGSERRKSDRGFVTARGGADAAVVGGWGGKNRSLETCRKWTVEGHRHRAGFTRWLLEMLELTKDWATRLAWMLLILGSIL